MLADVLTNLFIPELTADTTPVDPFAAADDCRSESDLFDAIDIDNELPADNQGDLIGPVQGETNPAQPDSDMDLQDNAEGIPSETDLPSHHEVDAGDGLMTGGDESIVTSADINELTGLPDQTPISPIDNPLPALGEDLGKSVFDPIFDLVTDVWDRFFQPLFDPDDIVHASDFSENGMLDTKNHLVVVGDVASDINFVSRQTGPTCALMAQEQFVHRLTGKPIPEDYLEWQAEKWRVYSPEIGTIPEGQEMILDHFNIPYDRQYSPDLDDIVKAMSKGNDVLIGVDAIVFSQDPSIPPDSGRAAALVGRSLDPSTGDLKGFYVTDSNFPGGAHFVTTEQLAAAWDGADMISVPEKLVA